MIEKIKKLFKLSESSNIHESQLAFKKAVELMKLHAIDKSQLQPTENIINEKYELPHGGRPWVKGLTTNIVKAFNGDNVYLKDYSKGKLKQIVHIFGESKDIKTIIIMLDYAFETVDKFCKGEHKKLIGMKRGYILGYMNSYRIGLMHQMNQTLNDIISYNKQDIDSGTEYGIILFNREKKINASLNQKYPNVTFSKSSIVTRNSKGYSSGEESGKSISFNPQTKCKNMRNLIAC